MPADRQPDPKPPDYHEHGQENAGVATGLAVSACPPSIPLHTITPTALAPRSALRFRASRSMQAMRTATPISTCA